LAQYGYFFVFTGTITVNPVRTGGNRKNEPGNKADPPGLLLEQKRHQTTGEQKPTTGNEIGQIEYLCASVQWTPTSSLT
jgi:hypothetical protein